MKRLGGRRLGSVALLSLLAFTTSFTAAAEAAGLRFTFEVPPGYAATNTGGAHTLYSPDADLAVEISSYALTSVADVEAALAGLPRDPSASQMYITGAAKKLSAWIWTMPLAGSDEGAQLIGAILLRLFPGKGAVMIRTSAVEGAEPGIVDVVASRVAKSLRAGKGAPGGQGIRAKKQPKLSTARVGPWQFSWPTGWERKAVSEGVVVVRPEPELLIMAHYMPGLDENGAVIVARQPFPVGGEAHAPVGEPAILSDRVVAEWRGSTLSFTAHARCHADGCLFLYAGSTHEHKLRQRYAVQWFFAHTAPDTSAARPLADQGGASQVPPATAQRRRPPDAKNRLAQKVTGKRLHFSITTGSSSGGVYVGGTSSREYHFCSDASVYAANQDELVATGYESSGRGARQGVWTTAKLHGRNALAIDWSDGRHETLLEYNPLAHVEAAMEQATEAQRREIEQILATRQVPNQVMLQRLGEEFPELFKAEPSSLCED